MKIICFLILIFTHQLVSSKSNDSPNLDFKKVQSQSWNEWKLKNGEAVSLIDSLKINQTLSNFMSYFQNMGYLETTVGFDLSKNNLKQKYATVDFNIKTGPQYYVGDVSLITKSKIIDSIYNRGYFENTVLN